MLLELISACYERRSMLITASQPLANGTGGSKTLPWRSRQWDLLVDHTTIVEMNVESYRRRTAFERKRVQDDHHRMRPKTLAD